MYIQLFIDSNAVATLLLIEILDKFNFHKPSTGKYSWVYLQDAYEFLANDSHVLIYLVAELYCTSSLWVIM